MQRGSQTLGLEVRYRWGDQLLGAEHFAPSRGLALHALGLRKQRFPLARQDDAGRFAVCFDDNTSGELWRGGSGTAFRFLRESAESDSSGTYSYAIEPGDLACIDFNGVRAEMSIAPVPPQAKVPLHRRIDNRFLNLLVLTTLTIAGAVITAVNYPQGADVVADDLSRLPVRVVRSVIQSAKPPPPRFAALLPSPRSLPDAESARHSGREGRAGARSAPERNAMMAPRGIAIDAHSLLHRGEPNWLPGRGVSSFGAVTGSGLTGELREAFGHLTGPVFGDARGEFGLGEKDNGPGGGGTSPSIGLARVDTHGIPHGLVGTGPALGPLGPKDAPPLPPFDVVPPTIQSYDKDMVRRVIHAHRNEVRFCYEEQLVRAPELTGKITVRFVISAEGVVESASIDQTTLHNLTVERCVTNHVRNWIFPKPKAGGVVVVSYPFLFRAAGE